ncbi:hypothetical protein ACLMJK_008695 [Lecanora helva]
MPLSTTLLSLIHHHDPHSLYALLPTSSTSPSQGYQKITYADFANATHGACWWLEETLGKPHGETVAFIGVNDLRYNVFVLAAAEIGIKMLLTSPRNSVAAHTNLCSLLECNKLLTTPEIAASPTIATLATEHGISIYIIPSWADLTSRAHPPYPYKTPSSNDALLALHTSGSTGLPKPLIITHGFISAYLDLTQLVPPEGYESKDRLMQGTRLLFMLPPFHAANHCVTLANAIFHSTVIVYPPSGAIPTAQVLVEVLRVTSVDVALVPPTVVAELGKDLGLLDFVVGKLGVLMYAGGDVPLVLGRVVASKMKLVNVYGVSELGVPPQISLIATDEEEDSWRDISFHPESGVVMERYDADGDLYEPCVKRREKEQPVFTLYPDRETFCTGDLFTPHPSRPESWTYSGRKDDIIVFLTGEKTNPTSMEERISSHEEVRSALIVGAQRFQAAVLVELTVTEILSTAEQADVIERLWPIIQEANKQCPRHAQVDKEHILLVSPEKPMLRSGKGTVQRRPTLVLYAEEIDALYAAADKAALSHSNGSQRPSDISDLDQISRAIREAVAEVVERKELSEDDNFFMLGMDSLQAIILARSLGNMFLCPDITISTVYSNPSISSLTRKISSVLVFGQQSELSWREERQREMQSLIAQYESVIDSMKSDLPSKSTPPRDRDPVSKEHTVLLTGSTGHLGSYLLRALLDCPEVAAVYCLDRNPNKISSNSALDVKQRSEPDSRRVKRLKADLSQEYLGLDEQTYESLVQQTTVIIHNAWPVDFNLPLSAFRPQITSVTRLIRFAASASQNPTLLFVSSIVSVLNSASSCSAIPESIIRDTAASSPMGYGESKFVAELLLAHASKNLNIDTRIARVGQVAGAVRSPGLWNMKEWIPKLILSSLYVGAVADSFGPTLDDVKWLPIDLLAEVLLEISFRENKHRQDSINLNGADANGEHTAQVFHLLNPHETTWSSLLPSILAALNAPRLGKGDIATASLESWIRRVRAKAEGCNGGDVEAMLKVNPAAKLLPFFEGLPQGTSKPVFALTETMQDSPKLRAMEAVKPEWMEKWVSEWLSAAQLGENSIRPTHPSL